MMSALSTFQDKQHEMTEFPARERQTGGNTFSLTGHFLPIATAAGYKTIMMEPTLNCHFYRGLLRKILCWLHGLIVRHLGKCSEISFIFLRAFGGDPTKLNMTLKLIHQVVSLA